MHPTCIVRYSAAIICKSIRFCCDYSVLLLHPHIRPHFLGFRRQTSPPELRVGTYASFLPSEMQFFLVTAASE